MRLDLMRWLVTGLCVRPLHPGGETRQVALQIQGMGGGAPAFFRSLLA